MSGIDLQRLATAAHMIRKGAASAVLDLGARHGGPALSSTWTAWSSRSAPTGGTPLVVAEQVGTRPAELLGVIHLKDVVKDGHPGALRRDARDGHRDRDGHGRQPAHRCGDRGEGRHPRT